MLTQTEALIRCQNQFRSYECQHRAKCTPEGYAKAEVNADMARLCEDALSSPKGDGPPVDGDLKEEIAVMLWGTGNFSTPQDADEWAQTILEQPIMVARLRAGMGPKGDEEGDFSAYKTYRDVMEGAAKEHSYKLGYKAGWDDRESDLLVGLDRILPNQKMLEIPPQPKGDVREALEDGFVTIKHAGDPAPGKHCSEFSITCYGEGALDKCNRIYDAFRASLSHPDPKPEGDDAAALKRYRAATYWVGADAWDGCSDCMDRLRWAAGMDLGRDMSSDDIAAAMRPFFAEHTAARRELKPEGAPAWRPEVRAFADLMEAQLKANDHKPGWKGNYSGDLFKRIADESEDLHAALSNYEFRDGSDSAADHIAAIGREAANVANLSLMIADVCGALSTPTDQQNDLEPTIGGCAVCEKSVSRDWERGHDPACPNYKGPLRKRDSLWLTASGEQK